MVKAIAPKAPIGATRITMPTRPNRTWVRLAMSAARGWARSPSRAMTAPKATASTQPCIVAPCEDRQLLVGRKHGHPMGEEAAGGPLLRPEAIQPRHAERRRID